MHALAFALNWAAALAYFERNPAEVDRLTSDLIELSTRHNLLQFLAIGAIYRGWARSVSGNTAEGIPWIEQGIRDYRATGAVLGVPIYLARKAEALRLARRNSEALEATNEAEALAERFENRYWCAELHRLKGVFLTAMGADDAQIQASFSAAIKTAKVQKSVSLEKRAEATYAEYRGYLFANRLEHRAFRHNPCLPPARRSLLRVLPAELPHYNPSGRSYMQRLIRPIHVDHGTRSTTLSLIR